jgi:hypothetical protein
MCRETDVTVHEAVRLSVCPSGCVPTGHIVDLNTHTNRLKTVPSIVGPTLQSGERENTFIIAFVFSILDSYCIIFCAIYFCIR